MGTLNRLRIIFCKRLFSLMLFLSLLTAPAYSQSAEVDSVKGVHADTLVQTVDRKIRSVDTTTVTTKAFSEEAIQKLKDNSDLNYKIPPTVAESIWVRFFTFLAKVFVHIFKGATTTGIGKAILYLLLFAIIVVTILTILKVNAFKIFFSGADGGKKNYSVFNENIHEMDFEKLIQDAVAHQKFREGTRLIFLYALKLLSDKQLIMWNPGKTNHDYVEELKELNLKTGLNELSFYFDYAWYGNFHISAETFQKLQKSFIDWRDKEVMKAK